jgi:hypothetical protein
MTIDQLIAILMAFLNQHHGSFYTSTRLRDNPNVCHACCTWFLNNVQQHGLASTIALLDTLDKNSFQAAQTYVTQGPSMPSKMLKQALASPHAKNQQDIDAIEFLISHHSQPNNYIGDVVTFVANLVVACRAGNQDRIMIYMHSGDGSGHVICLCRNVGGIVIYDPNMGVMTAQFSDSDTWSELLRRILKWYKQYMGFTHFGYKPVR